MPQAPKIEFRDFLPENSQRKAHGGLRFRNIFKQNNQEKPLVSIVTIVLNGEKYLRDTISSVLSQTYLNIEYIIIDGGSTDRTLQIIKEHQKKIDIWYSEPDKGIADAFNKGVSLARGEFIGIINSDDWFEKDAALAVVNNYKKEHFDVFCGKMAWIKKNKVSYYVNPKLENLKNHMSLVHPSMFVKREVYEEIGGFDPSYQIAMDYDFSLRLFLKNKQINITLEHVVNMRGIGISNKNGIIAARESLSIKNKNIGVSIKNYIYYLKEILIIRTTTLFRYLKFDFIIFYGRKIYFFLFRKHVQFKKDSL